MNCAIYAILVFTFFMASPVAAAECGNPKLRDEILRMVDEDQKARSGGPAHLPSPTEAAEMLRIDSSHAKRMREIVNEVGWPGISLVGADGAHGAWLLVQHFDLKDQDEYLPLLEKAVARREAAPKDFAYLLDRVRLHHGKKQVYGTQYRMLKEGEWTREPIEDEQKVDERRKSVGLPALVEYEKGLPNVKVVTQSVAEPAGAASQSQPVRAGTNPPSAAAGSGR